MEGGDGGVGAVVVLGLVLGVLCRTAFKGDSGVPYAALLLGLGAAAGALVDNGLLGGAAGDSIQAAQTADTALLLTALLPPLVFGPALFTDVHIFVRELWQVLTLAWPGVAATAGATAVFARLALPYDWGWSTALFFGAATAATDPTPVLAALRRSGVSERLTVLVEGEALLNDGSAAVLFATFLGQVDTNGGSGSHVAATFFRLALGGPLAGLVVGCCGAFCVGYLLEDPLSEITATAVVCYSAFLLAEETRLGVSGVLAAVYSGLYMSFYGRPRVSPSVQPRLRDFWSLATFASSTVVFFVAGLFFASAAGDDGAVGPKDWGLLLALFLYVNVVRMGVVLACFPVLRRGYGTDIQQLLLLAWSGVRGAVALLLALVARGSPGVDKDTGDRIVFLMSGLVLLSHLVNGGLALRLVRWLGLDRASDAETEMFVRACSTIEARLEQVVGELKRDRFLGDSDWPMVWRYAPVVTSRVYWHRIRVGSIVLAPAERRDVTAAAASSVGSDNGDNDNGYANSSASGGWFGGRGKAAAAAAAAVAASGEGNGRGMRWCFNCCGLAWRRASPSSATGRSRRRRSSWGVKMAADGEGSEAAEDGLRHLPPRLREPWRSYHRRFRPSAGSGNFGRAATASPFLPGDVDALIEGLANTAYDYDDDNGAFLLDATLHMPSRGSIRNHGSHSNANSPAKNSAANNAATFNYGNGSMKPGGDGGGAGAGSSSNIAGGASGNNGGNVGGSNSRLREMWFASDGSEGGGGSGNLGTAGGSGNLGSAGGSGLGLDLEDLRERSRSRSRGLTVGTFEAPRAAGGGMAGRDTTSAEFSLSLGGGSNHSLGNNNGGHSEGASYAVENGLAYRSWSGARIPAAQLRPDAMPTTAATAGNGSGHGNHGNGNGTFGGNGNFNSNGTGRLSAEAAWREAAAAKQEFLAAQARLRGLDDALAAAEAAAAAAAGRRLSGQLPDSAAAAAAMPANVRRRANRSAKSPTNKDEGSNRSNAAARAEARARFMTAVKSNYVSNARNGWLGEAGLRVLQDVADVQLDVPEEPLQEWSRLRHRLTLPPWQLGLASRLRSKPVVGNVAGAWIFGRLAAMFELASNFIAAHEDVDIGALLPAGEAADSLARENLRQLDDAVATLGQQLPAFPEVARSLKTQVSARFLLAKHRETVMELASDGFLTDVEADSLLKSNADSRRRLDRHPYAEHLPPRTVMLAKVPFLRVLGDEVVRRVVDDDRFCSEEFHGSNVTLLRQGDDVAASGPNRGVAGWFYIVRGSVQMTATVLPELRSATAVVHHSSVPTSTNLPTNKSNTTAGDGWAGSDVEYLQTIGGSTMNVPRRRERTLYAGCLFGMTDQMLGRKFGASYTTASFAHLFFFARDAFVEECQTNDELNRALWRTVGASVLRQFFGYSRLKLAELQKLIFSSEFVDLAAPGVGVCMTQLELNVEAIRARKRIRSNANIANVGNGNAAARFGSQAGGLNGMNQAGGVFGSTASLGAVSAVSAGSLTDAVATAAGYGYGSSNPYQAAGTVASATTSNASLATLGNLNSSARPNSGDGAATIGSGGRSGGNLASIGGDDGAIRVRKMDREPLTKTLSQMGLYHSMGTLGSMGSLAGGGVGDDAVLAAAGGGGAADGGSAAAGGGGGGGLPPGHPGGAGGVGGHVHDRRRSSAGGSAALALAAVAAQQQLLKVIEVEPHYYLLLVQGQLLPRAAAYSAEGEALTGPAAAAIEGHSAPALLTEVVGRVVLTRESKLFLMPVSLVARTRSSFVERTTNLSNISMPQAASSDHHHHQPLASVLTRDLSQLRMGSSSALLSSADVSGDISGQTGNLSLSLNGGGGSGVSGAVVNAAAAAVAVPSARRDIGLRQQLHRRHAEMARRASTRQSVEAAAAVAAGGVGGANAAAASGGGFASYGFPPAAGAAATAAANAAVDNSIIPSPSTGGGAGGNGFGDGGFTGEEDEPWLDGGMPRHSRSFLGARHGDTVTMVPADGPAATMAAHAAMAMPAIAEEEREERGNTATLSGAAAWETLRRLRGARRGRGGAVGDVAGGGQPSCPNPPTQDPEAGTAATATIVGDASADHARGGDGIDGVNAPPFAPPPRGPSPPLPEEWLHPEGSTSTAAAVAVAATAAPHQSPASPPTPPGAASPGVGTAASEETNENTLSGPAAMAVLRKLRNLRSAAAAAGGAAGERLSPNRERLGRGGAGKHSPASIASVSPPSPPKPLKPAAAEGSGGGGDTLSGAAAFAALRRLRGARAAAAAGGGSGDGGAAASGGNDGDGGHADGNAGGRGSGGGGRSGGLSAARSGLSDLFSGGGDDDDDLPARGRRPQRSGAEAGF